MSQLFEHKEDVGPGWGSILDELHYKVVEILPTYGVGQVKEKWGGLRIYLDYFFDIGELELPVDEHNRLTDSISSAVDDAEAKSLVTCEMCGDPGELRNVHGWFLTRCEACHA